MYKLRIIGDLGFEFWRDIPGYENRYQASTYGQIRSKDILVRSGMRNQSYVTKKGRLLKATRRNANKEYLRVGLSNGVTVKHFFVHGIIGQVFLPKWRIEYNQINHKDECPSNNRVENLEWCDAKYNCNYGTGAKRNGYSQRIVKDCLRKDDIQYVRERHLRSYERNKEKRKEEMKRYRETHKEYFKNYYQTHKEKWKNSE